MRRLKTYSAQSGYVYQYFYQGHREIGDGTEYVFQICADRKDWNELTVVISTAAVRAWEQDHERELSATERYAIAKVAMFQAFDERSTPAQMSEEVRVRNADIEAIVETLGL